MSADIISTLRERLFEADVITYGSAIAACLKVAHNGCRTSISGVSVSWSPLVWPWVGLSGKQGLWFRSVALLAALKRHDLEEHM